MRQFPAAEAAELKISFVGAEAGAAFDALGLGGQEGRERAVHFWDRPARGAGGAVLLPLLERGLILRLRRDRGGGPEAKRKADLTVKLRPCPELPEEWQREREEKHWEFRVEEDRAGPAFTPVLSASLEAERDFEEALEAERGPLGELLGHPQRELLEAARADGEDPGGLIALGPVHAVKWKQDWDGLPGSVAFEEWTTDGGLRFLEVSVRADLAEAAAAQDLLAAGLKERGLVPPPTGETKTRAVLTALARARLG
ncbi:hypothetical protein AB0F18_11065 [Streptomyces sp. NPDC029216]|uniref:hypothetical protein n=1 Tax=Streptomyces sp. NPDC029216 TaxID=3154701 RepID=UPI0033F2E0A5